MPHYVLLNFEDADPNAGPGKATAIKGKDVQNAQHIGGAAAGTANIYQNRALAKSSFFKKRQVVFYTCQEILQRNIAGTLAQTDLANIQKDCKSAKTIAFIIHGKPGETEHGFATTGEQLCSWKDLSKLALLILQPGHQYNIALIMCYGARSENVKIDHRGQIPDQDLKTSFAYKFFRSICRKRSIRMTARTGAVSNDKSINHMVETEEEVFLYLKMQKALAKRTLNKVSMDADKVKFFNESGLSKPEFEKQFGEALLHVAENPKYVPQNDLEKFAKDYIIYSSKVNQYLRAKYDPADLGNRAKYGKLIYTYDGHTLEIIARYGTDHHGPNFQLYYGRLL
ncbi:MAG TPA: hypothetical protein VHT24_02730 [Pseudacidobacterium sp.]|jgi:hypothetical protein|nr:hypothetical protein [Pseudacidobacterium sp.]